ncbi:MAG: hypothetical protein WCP79_12025 [Bacillota bacterium]
MLRKFIYNRQGAILPVVMISVVIIAVIVVGILMVQRSNLSTTTTENTAIQTQNRADYDLATAVLKFKADIVAALTDSSKLDNTSVVKRLILPKDNNTYRTNTNSATGVSDAAVIVKDKNGADVGSYIIKCYNDMDVALFPNNRLLQFTGKFGSVTKVITHRLTLVPPGVGTGMGKYALFAQGNIRIGNDLNITGDVAANGWINYDDDWWGWWGWAWHHYIRGTINGTVTPYINYPGVAAIMPGKNSTLPFTDRDTYSGTGKALPTWTKDKPEIALSGTYYKSGDWNISKHPTFTAAAPVIIYVTGRINASDDVTFRGTGANGSIALLVEKDITFKNDPELTKVLVVTAQDFEARNSASGSGAIVCGGDIYVKNHFDYDGSTYQGYPGLFDFNPSGGSGTTDWQVIDNGVI